MIGIVADWFPDPRGGWHAGGGFGFGGFTAHEESGDDGSDGLALAGTLFGGYDHWIGNEYSLGFMLAGTLAAPADAELDDTPTGYRFRTASFAILPTLLFH